MLSAALLSVLALALNTANAHPRRAPTYVFRPEADSSYWKSGIPIVFNHSESQLATTVNQKPAVSSYWTSSYLTGENGQQYLAISHVLISKDNSSYYRASTLDLGQPDDYHSFVVYSDETALLDSPLLNVAVDNNGFESLSDDNVSRMRTFSNHQDVTFDLTFNATSATLVDGAVGLFTFGDGLTYEWGFPNCYTEGSITVNGRRVAVDPKKSFTWYDRQWNDGFPSTGNWTWFELHIPHSRDKLSIWAIDNEDPEQTIRFATIRKEDGSQNVVPTTFVPDYSRQWHSAATGRLYPMDWTVLVGDEIVLRISSVVENQEIVGDSVLSTAYEGFVTFKGQFGQHHADGFGVVEVLWGH